MDRLHAVKVGFSLLPVEKGIQDSALLHLSRWLTDAQFLPYKAQIEHLIEQKKYALLLDSFYQVIPFGTGGRRGAVGIGPNRINPYTISASAWGHATYLLRTFGESAKKKGVVLAYDVRTYPETGIYNPKLPNPIRGITSKDFAMIAAEVYAAHGIRVYFFDDMRTTPELSFAVRFLGAIAGDVFSASHNPMTDNGKKVYGNDGGQLIPPEDQKLSDIVEAVTDIKRMPFSLARKKGLVSLIGKRVDEAYLEAVLAQSVSSKKSAIVVFSPLHGVGGTSALAVLRRKGVRVIVDEKTSTPNGFFPHIKFNIPNPEVPESMETLAETGKKHHADIALCTDPDADRVGLMVWHKGAWVYLSGNEIAILLTAFLVSKGKKGTFVKTCVTTELSAQIAKDAGLSVKGDLLVGFKYIAEEIRKLEAQKKEQEFVLGAEESHGILIGTYARDKDAAPACLLLCELASELKEQKKTLIDYLDEIYLKYGYHQNELNSLIFEGAQGKKTMDVIQKKLRQDVPKAFGTYKVIRFVDRWADGGFLSETDRASRNVLQWYLAPPSGISLIKLTIRPSGTEPKTKLYIEVGAKPPGKKATAAKFSAQKKLVHKTLRRSMDAFVLHAYALAGIRMPKRGLRLSWLLSVDTKLKYFDVEKQLILLKEAYTQETISKKEFVRQAHQLLLVFGKDPIEKINGAFVEKMGVSLQKFLKR